MLSHFITFSGVTVLYWFATSDVYAASTLSLPMLTALPIRSPTGAASAPSESAGGRNPRWSESEPFTALAAVAPSRTAVAQATPTVRIRRTLTWNLLDMREERTRSSAQRHAPIPHGPGTSGQKVSSQF